MDKTRLNALLAEHLRGWTKQEKQVAGETVTVWVDPDATGMQKREYQAHELPDLAGTWTGMGIVVEAMSERGYDFFIDVRRYAPTHALFTHRAKHLPQGSYSGKVETPIATGYAALKAVGVEVE